MVIFSTLTILNGVTGMRGTRIGPGYQCDEGKDVEAGWFKLVKVMPEAL